MVVQSGKVYNINNKKSLGHPGRIKQYKNGTIKYTSFTHSDVTQRVNNIPLNSNPDINDLSPSYVRPRVFVGHVEDVGLLKENMIIKDSNDKSILRKLMKKGSLK